MSDPSPSEVALFILGALVSWLFLYSVIYSAVKAALRDAQEKPRFDPEKDDRPLVRPPRG